MYRALTYLRRSGLSKTCSILLCFVLAMTPQIGFSRDLTVLTTPYYGDQKLFPNYVETYGAPPRFTFFDLNEQAMTLVKNGMQADVVHVCFGPVNTWLDAGIVAHWDRTMIRDVELPEAMAPTADILNAMADQYVPFEYGTTRLMYNSQQVPRDHVETLDIFANPEYRGKLALPAFIDDLAAAAFLAQGVTDWSRATDENLEAAIDWLKAVHPNIHSYWNDEDDLWSDLASGEVLIAWGWNSTYSDLQSTVRNIDMAPASSGASKWNCGYIRLKGSDDHIAEAHAFVSAALSPKSGLRIMSWGSGFANRAVEDKFSDGFDAVKSGLAATGGPVLEQTPMPSKLRERFMQAAQDIMAGS
jgi:spermidine/putrescine transport system substrate-binding protein